MLILCGMYVIFLHIKFSNDVNGVVLHVLLF